MHASVTTRRAFETCNEVTHDVTNEFALMNDHTMLLQGRFKSIPIQGGGIRNNIGYSDGRSINESCGKRCDYPQTYKTDVTVPKSTETSIFDADEYAIISNVSDIIPTSEGSNVQDERQNKGEEFFYCDWSELGSLDDFETNLRNYDSTFEKGSNYFEDPLWSSVCLPDAQHVPSSCLFDNTNLSTVSNESSTKPIISTSTEPLFLDQIFGLCRNMHHILIYIHTFLKRILVSPRNIFNFSIHCLQINMANDDVFCTFDNVTSAELIGSCERLEAIFCSYQEVLVPTTSSIMYNDEIVSSSTLSAPDPVAAYVPHSMEKSHDPLNGTPDMILDEMAGNPLDMYFPPLTAYEHPEQPTNATLTETHQFPEGFGGDDVLKSADLQFFSSSPLILEAVPVKDLGFQKLQESMNQDNRECSKRYSCKWSRGIMRFKEVEQTSDEPYGSLSGTAASSETAAYKDCSEWQEQWQLHPKSLQQLVRERWEIGENMKTAAARIALREGVARARLPKRVVLGNNQDTTLQ
ncbi:hypothetical protein ABZP36_031753 [Zizania latifolia]